MEPSGCDTGGMVMARVRPRLELGTTGSSGSPEAEDAVAMAAFTTLSHELISACRGQGDISSHSKTLTWGSLEQTEGRYNRRK